MLRKIMVLALLLLWSTPIFAEEALFEFPIRPVGNSNRVIGLGGAFVGIAEGADGHTYNPASFASRFSYSRDQLWDWDWTLYWLNLPTNDHSDFGAINSTSNNAFHLGLGIDVKYSLFGAGVHGYTSQYKFFGDDNYFLTQTVGLIGLGLTLPKFQLSIGATLNSGSSEVQLSDEVPINFEGTGASFGVLWFPPSLPFRIGANLRLPQKDKELNNDDDREFEFVITQPGELTLGASWMFWEKKHNPIHTFGDRYEKGETTNKKRRYVLIAADLVTTFQSPTNTFAITSVIDSVARSSGEDLNIGLRLGIESEVLDNRLRLRTGYYQLPSRLQSIPTYHHFTAGADLRVTLGWDWKLNTVLDISKDYFNFGFGLGLWH